MQVVDAFRSRLGLLMTVTLLISASMMVLAGSALFLVQCQRELVQVATHTQTLWQSQVFNHIKV
jgi:hypothetical protein